MSDNLTPAYIQGFHAKCAEYNVDSRELFQQLNSTTKTAGVLDALKKLLNSGKPTRLTSDPMIPLNISNLSPEEIRSIVNVSQRKVTPVAPGRGPLINGGQPLTSNKLSPTKYVP